MQSRYYDPEIGRFLNADTFASTGQGIVGNNMFTYCLNNPSVFADDSGDAAKICFSYDGQQNYTPWKKDSPGGGGWPQGIHISQRNHGSAADKFITVGVLKFVLNTNEQVVLNAEYLAFYKGTLVLKLDFLDDAGFSFGLIALGPNVDDQTVRHEYGHFLHLQMIGIKNYTLKVLLPSLNDYWSDMEYKRYYSEPQEYIADILGGVNRMYGSVPYQYTISDSEAILYFIYSIIP